MTLYSIIPDSNAPLVSYAGETLTCAEFRARTASWAELLPGTLRGPVLVQEPHPVQLYGLVFALWKKGFTAVFPTKNILERGEIHNFYAHTVRALEGGLLLEDNPSYVDHGIPASADTVVFSSGTTSAPKGILHNRLDFVNNARSVADVIGLDRGASATTLRPYTVSAFAHFLMHALTGSHLRFLDFERPGDLTEIFSREPRTALVGSPLQLLSALRFLPRGSDPAFFFSSGDFLHDGPISRMIERFPGSVVYKVYGLSEIAGRFFIQRIDARTSPEEYPLLGKPVPGTSYSVENGELLADSEGLFSGYVTDRGIEPARRPHHTGDLVRRNEKGLYLAGRSDANIKVGGSFVSLDLLEAKISSVLFPVPFVLAARSHETLGNIVCLCVKADARPERARLVRDLRKVLDAREMPHEYYALDDIPVTESQKKDRARAAALIAGLEPLV